MTQSMRALPDHQTSRGFPPPATGSSSATRFDAGEAVRPTDPALRNSQLTNELGSRITLPPAIGIGTVSQKLHVAAGSCWSSTTRQVAFSGGLPPMFVSTRRLLLALVAALSLLATA